MPKRRRFAPWSGLLAFQQPARTGFATISTKSANRFVVPVSPEPASRMLFLATGIFRDLKTGDLPVRSQFRLINL